MAQRAVVFDMDGVLIDSEPLWREAEVDVFGSLGGKPHPAIYLSTAHQLGVAPNACVAVEDSVNGILAAKAARMACVAVPAPELRGDRRLGIADVVLASLHALDVRCLDRLVPPSPG